MDGYMGKALLVDLGNGSTESWDLPQEWCKDYLGGEGLAIRMFYEYMDPDREPFDPEAPILFATGPLNGSPEIANAAEAPMIEGTAGSTSLFSDITVTITCTSLVNPLGNRGRKGRSINREFRISPSLGLPSRLKKPPGILPAA